MDQNSTNEVAASTHFDHCPTGTATPVSTTDAAEASAESIETRSLGGSEASERLADCPGASKVSTGRFFSNVLTHTETWINFEGKQRGGRQIHESFRSAVSYRQTCNFP